MVDMSSLCTREVTTTVANETIYGPYAVRKHRLHVELLTVDTVKFLSNEYTAMRGGEVVSMQQSRCHYSPLRLAPV